MSKAIIELEEELGVDIFARHGKRLKRITEPGQHVLQSIEIIMREVGNLKRIGEQFSAQDSGTLSIATTHTQARYVLPVPVASCARPTQSQHQPAPGHTARSGPHDHRRGGRDRHGHRIPGRLPELVTLPCYEWQHVLVVPNGHPLAQKERIGLDDRRTRPSSPTTHPSPGAARSTRPLRRASSRPHRARGHRLRRDQTYVRLGLGIGIVAEMAMRDDPWATWWCARGPLFGKAWPAWPSSAAPTCAISSIKFAELLSDRLSRELIARAMTGHVNDYEPEPAPP